HRQSLQERFSRKNRGKGYKKYHINAVFFFKSIFFAKTARASDIKIFPKTFTPIEKKRRIIHSPLSGPLPYGQPLRAASPLPPRRIVKRSKHLFQTASSGLMAALEGNHETGKAIPLIFVPRFGILSF
ncbi:MAG: hypothetical protein Q3X05_06440, partial [Bilophila sp.]|nr:hypothetical protein [Bilophila sp.]